jgi:hypothetical protein
MMMDVGVGPAVDWALSWHRIFCLGRVNMHIAEPVRLWNDTMLHKSYDFVAPSVSIQKKNKKTKKKESVHQGLRQTVRNTTSQPSLFFSSFALDSVFKIWLGYGLKFSNNRRFSSLLSIVSTLQILPASSGAFSSDLESHFFFGLFLECST